MYAQVEKPKENNSRAVANSVAQKKSNGKQSFGFVDNRPESIAQRATKNTTVFSKPTTQLVSKYITLSGHFKGAIKKDSKLLGLSPERLKGLSNELSAITKNDDLIIDGAHGNENSFGKYSPEKLAERLIEKGLQQVRFIELRGCETGKDFSQKLKDSLIKKGVEIIGGIDAPITSGTNAAKDGAQTAYKPEAQKIIDDYEGATEKLGKYTKKKAKVSEAKRKKHKYEDKIAKKGTSEFYESKVKKYENRLSKSERYNHKITKYENSLREVKGRMEGYSSIESYKDDPKNEELSPAHQRLRITNRLVELEELLISKTKEKELIEKENQDITAISKEIESLKAEIMKQKSTLFQSPDKSSPWKRV